MSTENVTVILVATMRTERRTGILVDIMATGKNNRGRLVSCYMREDSYEDEYEEKEDF